MYSLKNIVEYMLKNDTKKHRKLGWLEGIANLPDLSYIQITIAIESFSIVI